MIRLYHIVRTYAIGGRKFRSDSLLRYLTECFIERKRWRHACRRVETYRQNNISPELFIENARVRVYHLHTNFNFHDKEGP